MQCYLSTNGVDSTVEPSRVIHVPKSIYIFLVQRYKGMPVVPPVPALPARKFLAFVPVTVLACTLLVLNPRPTVLVVSNHT